LNRIVLKKLHHVLYYKSHCQLVNSTVPSPATALAIRPVALSALLPTLLCVGLLAGCGEQDLDPPVVRGGEAAAGKRLVTQYQCGTCHAIPEVQGAGGDAGPPLEHMRRKSYIANGIPNRPERMVAWLRDPPALKPGTRMPSMGLSEQEARHIAAYLYTLE
jgi:cytochrome c1